MSPSCPHGLCVCAVVQVCTGVDTHTHGVYIAVLGACRVRVQVWIFGTRSRSPAVAESVGGSGGHRW